ncbi:MAG: hypothetical protein JXM73_17280 [Anaerolineae bacterium]|nr:hypothetical protein [Anaerolineae bacterium]
MTGATAVASGWGHSVARRSDRVVWAWGRNLNGQLGDGTMTDRLIGEPAEGLSAADDLVLQVLAFEVLFYPALRGLADIDVGLALEVLGQDLTVHRRPRAAQWYGVGAAQGSSPPGGIL